MKNNQVLTEDLFAPPPRAAVVAPEPEDDSLFTVHTRQCSTCGAEFQTCGKGRRCSSCLVGPGEAEKAARITCRVCSAQASVPLDHPALLCPPCLEDLDATRDRVAEWLEAALGALEANQARWEVTKAQSDAFSRWPAIQGALIAVADKRTPQSALDATWRKRKAEGGALAQLLTAYEGYAEECDRIGAELARLDAAQREINQAFLATEL